MQQLTIAYLFLLMSIPKFASTQSLDTTRVTTGTELTGARAEWVAKWTGSLEYSLETLAALSEDDLDFRPTPEQMSLREQFQHMATNVFSLTSRFLYQPEGFDLAARRESMSTEADKATLERTLREAYLFGEAACKALPDGRWAEPAEGFWVGEKSKRVVFHLLQDHATHHRAQTLVYLRLLGHQPPAYRGW